MILFSLLRPTTHQDPHFKAAFDNLHEHLSAFQTEAADLLEGLTSTPASFFEIPDSLRAHRAAVDDVLALIDDKIEKATENDSKEV